MSRRKAGLYSIPETLGQALYHLVHHSPQSVATQAEQLHLSPQVIYNIGNPNLEVEGVAYPLKHLIPHTRLTQNFTVVDFIESQLGRVGIALPSGEAMAAPVTAEDMLALAKEFGDVAREVATGLAGDRVIDGAEKPRCRKELYELLQKTAELWRRLDASEGSC